MLLPGACKLHSAALWRSWLMWILPTRSATRVSPQLKDWADVILDLSLPAPRLDRVSKQLAINNLFPGMICSVCYRMLRGQEGRQWRGTYDLHFAHHRSQSSLTMSADMGCCFCSGLRNELLQLSTAETTPKIPGHYITAFLCGIGVHTTALGQLGGTASHAAAATGDYIRQLTSVHVHDSGTSLADFLSLYRLDFKLNDTRRLGSYLLRPAGE